MKSVKGIEIEDKYKILSIDGYFARVYEIMQEEEQPTMYEAYLRTEAELENYGVQRYISYGSFKRSKHFHYNKETKPAKHNTMSLFD